jgi:acetate kinase
MRILVLNVGSSTIKFQLIDTDGAAIAAVSDKRLARGQIERIGGEAIVTVEATGREPVKSAVPLRDHAAAVEYLIGWLVSEE